MTVQLDLGTIRVRWKAEYAQLQKYIAGEQTMLQQALEASPDLLDQAQTTTARERRRALLAQAQAHINQVEVALSRLRDGTYRTDTVCGQLINAKRLVSLPYAITCIQCQQQREHSIGAGE
jgi:DnaK suppressor protein